MKRYDPSKPLIVIHIPKAAGSSVKRVFRKWFGEALYENYADELRGSLPERRELSKLQEEGRPVAIYGHFNRLRGFGVEDYYPDVTQFITILRDPYEAAISGYYYVRKHGSNWLDKSRIPVQIGVMEHLPESVGRIAEELGMPFQSEWLPHVNSTTRDQAHPDDLRDEYVERHRLEFEVYGHVTSRLGLDAGWRRPLATLATSRGDPSPLSAEAPRP